MAHLIHAHHWPAALGCWTLFMCSQLDEFWAYVAALVLAIPLFVAGIVLQKVGRNTRKNEKLETRN